VTDFGCPHGPAARPQRNPCPTTNDRGILCAFPLSSPFNLIPRPQHRQSAVRRRLNQGDESTSLVGFMVRASRAPPPVPAGTLPGAATPGRAPRVPNSGAQAGHPAEAVDDPPPHPRGLTTGARLVPAPPLVQEECLSVGGRTCPRTMLENVGLREGPPGNALPRPSPSCLGPGNTRSPETAHRKLIRGTSGRPAPAQLRPAPPGPRPEESITRSRPSPCLGGPPARR